MIGNVVLELSLNPALTVGLVVLESDDNGVIDGVVDDDCIDEPILASVLLFSKSPDLVCWLFSIRVIFSGKSFSNKRCSTPLHSTFIDSLNASLRSAHRDGERSQQRMV